MRAAMLCDAQRVMPNPECAHLSVRTLKIILRYVLQISLFLSSCARGADETWKYRTRETPSSGESLRGNRPGATGLRASERKSASERVSEREGFQRFLRGFERFLEVFRGFERFSEVFRAF